jgi:hypothetical protein
LERLSVLNHDDIISPLIFLSFKNSLALYIGGGGGREEGKEEGEERGKQAMALHSRLWLVVGG